MWPCFALSRHRPCSCDSCARGTSCLLCSTLPMIDASADCMHCSGYDFGYFVKLLTGQSLPTNEETFFDVLHTWFPTIYDIKFVMRSCKVLKGGLQDVADDLGVRLPHSLDAFKSWTD